MTRFLITFTNGTTKLITAQRYEEGVAGVTFYDDNGDVIETFANSQWQTIEARGEA